MGKKRKIVIILIITVSGVLVGIYGVSHLKIFCNPRLNKFKKKGEKIFKNSNNSEMFRKKLPIRKFLYLPKVFGLPAIPYIFMYSGIVAVLIFMTRSNQNYLNQLREEMKEELNQLKQELKLENQNQSNLEDCEFCELDNNYFIILVGQELVLKVVTIIMPILTQSNTIQDTLVSTGYDTFVNVTQQYANVHAPQGQFFNNYRWNYNFYRLQRATIHLVNGLVQELLDAIR